MESYSSDSSYATYASESSLDQVNSPQQYQGSGRMTNVKCRYFMNNGYCFYGEACQFLHSTPQVSNGYVSPSYQRQDSSYYNEGIVKENISQRKFFLSATWLPHC